VPALPEFQTIPEGSTQTKGPDNFAGHITMRSGDREGPEWAGFQQGETRKAAVGAAFRVRG
jgi:hypothetical protein